MKDLKKGDWVTFHHSNIDKWLNPKGEPIFRKIVHIKDNRCLVKFKTPTSTVIKKYTMWFGEDTLRKAKYSEVGIYEN